MTGFFQVFFLRLQKDFLSALKTCREYCSLSNSRQTWQLSRQLTVYIEKSIITLAKKSPELVLCSTQIFNKCKHPDKCKQFYQFIFACRNKPQSCFVNIHCIQSCRFVHCFLQNTSELGVLLASSIDTDLKVVSATFLQVCFVCLKERTCETRKKFLFDLESSFRS